jgi:hypothetical protein
MSRPTARDCRDAARWLEHQGMCPRCARELLRAALTEPDLWLSACGQTTAWASVARGGCIQTCAWPRFAVHPPSGTAH